MATYALAALPILRGGSLALAGSAVESVEEDWSLVVGTPDKANNAPGVKMIMSPQADLLGYSADYNINFHKQGNPDAYIPGGYGIDLCDPTKSSPINVASTNGAFLNTPGETLTWTQRLRLSRGNLTFSLRNTSSTTWGTINGMVLSVSTTCPLADLSAYDPTQSVANSGPIWWRDRVTSLTLTQVRYYDVARNLLSTDSTVRSAYP
jgi:hypothetical protein